MWNDKRSIIMIYHFRWNTEISRWRLYCKIHEHDCSNWRLRRFPSIYYLYTWFLSFDGKDNNNKRITKFTLGIVPFLKRKYNEKHKTKTPTTTWIMKFVPWLEVFFLKLQKSRPRWLRIRIWLSPSSIPRLF